VSPDIRALEKLKTPVTLADAELIRRLGTWC